MTAAELRAQIAAYDAVIVEANRGNDTDTATLYGRMQDLLCMELALLLERGDE